MSQTSPSSERSLNPTNPDRVHSVDNWAMRSKIVRARPERSKEKWALLTQICCPCWYSDHADELKSSFSVFQHDEFADSMPVSEQEFIFIRLCVLREVRFYQQYFCSINCACGLFNVIVGIFQFFLFIERIEYSASKFFFLWTLFLVPCPRAHHGQPAFSLWLWEECRRLGLHVLLCWKWLSSTSSIFRNQVCEMETKSAAVGAFTSETLLLFPNREGAIDRLVSIYKDVVHKTGVSLTACFSHLVPAITTFFFF